MMPKLWQLLLKTSVVMIILSASHPVLAAEEVIFTHGILSQSVSIEELEQFALTGEMSPSVQFLFDYSKQNPEVVRSVLTQPLPTNQILMANLFNTAPGELVLGETSQLFHTKSHRSSKEALRATLIASAQDDNQISLLELLQNYPTTQVYIDSKSLGNTVRTVNNLVNTVENNFELPLTVLEDWIKGL
ncbi:protein of unknown function DUF1400 [Stanieria cyanosphaera PCC 7437]|uniref:DUF1400 domain-containing protein n=2 Tax=Stanieria cyanosphaera TaxID=102116 RepID=K9XR31_STAC7|nr:protein of unknown function DUF1400 [Stanieria cyanosphaera PCC 7437]